MGKVVGQHGPRIKVSNGIKNASDSFTVTISKHPYVIGTHKLNQHDIDNIFEWVILNYDII